MLAYHLKTLNLEFSFLFQQLSFSVSTRSSDFNSSFNDVQSPAEDSTRPQDLLGPEALVAFSLLLLLVWFLNREFEVNYRLHYHGNVEADQHRIKIQNMRDQADWLLRNIIPIHVAEQLKVTQSYSKNHDNVGVIFASIVNFSEFYEESYEGGEGVLPCPKRTHRGLRWTLAQIWLFQYREDQDDRCQLHGGVGAQYATV